MVNPWNKKGDEPQPNDEAHEGIEEDDAGFGFVQAKWHGAKEGVH